jgi:hypothetical protein
MLSRSRARDQLIQRTALAVDLVDLREHRAIARIDLDELRVGIRARRAEGCSGR